ncbi:hypothetical protein NC652_035842 [Populus alba x Populus x berolinensis]|nr:hypothetical protein NC652_035842 [Populus alba x Populus x berolinensis]
MGYSSAHPSWSPETMKNDKENYKELSELAEQAKRCTEVARLRELHTLKGHVESVVKMKGLDIETIQQHYSPRILKGFRLESYVNRQNKEANLKQLFLCCKQFFFYLNRNVQKDEIL